MTQYIDCTPTWRSVVRLLVEVAANATTAESRNLAMRELDRMAAIADIYVAKQKDENNVLAAALLVAITPDQ